MNPSASSDFKPMLVALKRTLKLAWINFVRNIGLSLVAVFAMAVALLFLIFALIVSDLAERVLSDVRDQVSVSIYFRDGVDEETVLAVKEEIEGISDIREVNYVSRQAALERFILRHKDNAILMAALAEVGNPFLSSLEIISETTEGYEGVMVFLEENPSRIFFEKIDYDERRIIIEEIFKTTSVIQRTGFVTAAVMAFISILIVFNIIRLAIYGMREEISILRLVGVSRNYLTLSFIFQGMITAVAGVLTTVIVLFLVVMIFGERIAGVVPGLDIGGYLLTNASFLLLIQLGVAVVLTVFSSLIAVAKYLKT